MISIVYLKGDATVPQAKGNKIICHVCNDLGRWGKGFVMALSARWPQPEAEYRRWHRERSQDDFVLGRVQLVQASPNVVVANMIGQHGIKAGSNGPPIRYDAIEKCLNEVAHAARKMNASVHMPRIGCGLAGGKWERIEPLIIKTLCERDILVQVYDFDG
jgi:O-acetyl-ADP-ribose deacetylase (regulator of RNase III)